MNVTLSKRGSYAAAAAICPACTYPAGRPKKLCEISASPGPKASCGWSRSIPNGQNSAWPTATVPRWAKPAKVLNDAVLTRLARATVRSFLRRIAHSLEQDHAHRDPARQVADGRPPTPVH